MQIKKIIACKVSARLAAFNKEKAIFRRICHSYLLCLDHLKINITLICNKIYTTVKKCNKKTLLSKSIQNNQKLNIFPSTFRLTPF